MEDFEIVIPKWLQTLHFGDIGETTTIWYQEVENNMNFIPFDIHQKLIREYNQSTKQDIYALQKIVIINTWYSKKKQKVKSIEPGLIDENVGGNIRVSMKIGGKNVKPSRTDSIGRSNLCKGNFI